MVMAPRAEIAAVDPNKAIVRGYASVTGNPFLYFDPHKGKLRTMAFDPGAFATVLGDLGERPVDVFWQHETFKLQLGKTQALREDSTGLYYEAIPFATADVIDQLTVMHGKSRVGASVGIEFGRIVERDGVERIQSVKSLLELGPAPAGVNPLAWSEVVPRDAAIGLPAPATADAAMAAEIYRATHILRSFYNG